MNFSYRLPLPLLSSGCVSTLHSLSLSLHVFFPRLPPSHLHSCTTIRRKELTALEVQVCFDIFKKVKITRLLCSEARFPQKAGIRGLSTVPRDPIH